MLAEARIGTELKAAQEAGEVATQDRHPNSVRASDTAPATLPQLGIHRQRAAEYKALAAAGPDAIRYHVRGSNMLVGSFHVVGDTSSWQPAIMPDDPSPQLPTMQPITNDELIAAIVEVASIQIEMVRQVDAAIRNVQLARPGAHQSKVFSPYPLMSRSQLLIRWLLAHVSSSKASEQPNER